MCEKFREEDDGFLRFVEPNRFAKTSLLNYKSLVILLKMCELIVSLSFL